MAEASATTILSVPFSEKEQAKKLGARWDPEQKHWWIPPGVERAPFARWLNTVGDSAPLYLNLPPIDRSEFEDYRSLGPVEAFFVPWTCWKCKRETLAFHGAIDRGICVTQLLYQARVLEKLDKFRQEVRLERFGCIKPRFSRTANSSYVSQGCRYCDALIGEFPLQEDFSEVLSTLDLSTYPLCTTLGWSVLDESS